MSWEGKGTKDFFAGEQLSDNRIQVFTTASAAPEIVLAPNGLDKNVLIADLRIWPSNLLDDQLHQLFKCSSACATNKCTGPSAEDCDKLKEKDKHCAIYIKLAKGCKKCNDGYTLRDNACVPCFYNYKKCSSYKKYEAIECIDNFYLFQGDCVATCPKDYYRNTGQCYPCKQDPDNEDCIDFMAQDSYVHKEYSGAKFTPSSFMLT